MENEYGLVEIVVTEKGYIKARSNEFDNLPMEALSYLKKELNSLIDRIDAVGEKKGAKVDTPKPVITINLNGKGVTVVLNNPIIKSLDEKGVFEVMKGLKEGLDAIREKAMEVTKYPPVNPKNIN